jgi:hypothetical protein
MAGFLDWLTGSAPAEDASKFYQQIPGQVSPYFNPFFEAGKGAIPILQGQYNNLISNPTDMMNKIGGGYQQSPGFKYALDQALGSANRLARAGGTFGTPSNMSQDMGIATNMANQDYWNYLKTALGQYGQGLQGEQNLLTGGQTAGSNMAQMIAQALAQQGNLKFQGEQAQEGFLGNLIGAGAQALPFIFGA